MIIVNNFFRQFTIFFTYFFIYSRAAVLRGRVVTTSGRGLTGVRVTHADIHTEGYTMTQEDGWFDFMVNGGRSCYIDIWKISISGTNPISFRSLE